MIQIVWFCLVALLIAGYVVLDGFRSGRGRNPPAGGENSGQSHKLVLGSIGPVWDGNEVWLVAGGGMALYFKAFPAFIRFPASAADSTCR